MDPVSRAFSDAQQSYQSCKAALRRGASAALTNPAASNPTQTELARAKDQYRANRSWVYAAVRSISSAVAGQPIHIARAGTGRAVGVKAQRPEPLVSHPLLDLLADPCDWLSSWGLMYVTAASLELTGRALWWLDQDSEGKLRALPVPTSWLVEIGGSLSFDTFYLRPPGHAGEPIALPSTSAVYLHYPDPSSPRSALSPLQACAASVAADEAILSSQASAFQRGIFPSVALHLGKDVTPDGQQTGAVPVLTGSRRRQLVETIRQWYGGVARSGEPLILDGLIDKVSQLALKPAEMNWLESSKLTKARILQTFGVNPIILGEVEGANRASSLAAQEHFAATVNPKLRLLGEALTEWLAPHFGPGLVVWIEPLVPHDPELDISRRQLLAKSGAVTVNELRVWAGLPELDWGDVPAGQAESIREQLAALAERAVQ